MWCDFGSGLRDCAWGDFRLLLRVCWGICCPGISFDLDLDLLFLLWLVVCLLFTWSVGFREGWYNIVCVCCFWGLACTVLSGPWGWV